MKLSLIILLLFIQSLMFGQTYSTVIPDSVIEEFIKWEIVNTTKYAEKKEKGKKKIYFNPISWKEAMVHMFAPFGEETSFYSKFERLMDSDSIFADIDTCYLRKQYEGEIINEWNLNLASVKISKKSIKYCYEYTIPMFSKNKRKVFVWKYIYCGSLCAQACLYVYERKENTDWELIGEYGCWVS